MRQGNTSGSVGQVKADEEATQQTAAEPAAAGVQPDAPIGFLQLSSRADLAGTENVFELSLSQAVGASKNSAADFSTSKLSKVSFLLGLDMSLC